MRTSEDHLRPEALERIYCNPKAWCYANHWWMLQDFLPLKQ